MIKRLFLLMSICLASLNLSAQKFAVVDMEYILKNVPAYERASEQLNQISKKWQAEIETLQKKVQSDYKNLQNEAVFLSDEQKVKKEEAIIAKEKEVTDLKKKYFGPEGELFKKRQALVTPIQEEIYNAVKDIADSKDYSLILDRSSEAGIIFSSPKIDISNEVLAKLGFSN